MAAPSRGLSTWRARKFQRGALMKSSVLWFIIFDSDPWAAERESIGGTFKYKRSVINKDRYCRVCQHIGGDATQ